MKIKLNGKPHEMPAATGLLQLLESLQVNPDLVAVELNLDIVKRADRAGIVLKEGDEVEVIRMIGGGHG
jgi:sulfur carrier protein